MAHALALYLSRYAALSEPASARLRDLPARQYRVPARMDFSRAGIGDRWVVLVESGWAMDYRLTRDGRQIPLGLDLPGDLNAAGFPATRVKGGDTLALTAATVATYRAERIEALLAECAELACAFLAMKACQEILLRERVATLLRLDAPQRLAYLILELEARLAMIGAARDGAFAVPLNQAAIGGLIGVHEVHVSRLWRRLQSDGLIARSRNTIAIQDRRALVEMVETDPARLFANAPRGRAGHPDGPERKPLPRGAAGERRQGSAGEDDDPAAPT